MEKTEAGGVVSASMPPTINQQYSSLVGCAKSAEIDIKQASGNNLALGIMVSAVCVSNRNL